MPADNFLTCFVNCTLECRGLPFPLLPGRPAAQGMAKGTHAPCKNPIHLVCMQRLYNVKEQKSFKLKLPVCFLRLEKYSVHSPNRGILRQELNFAFDSQRLEVTLAQGAM